MKEKFFMALRIIADVTGKKISDETLEFYFVECEKMGIERVNNALVGFVKSGRWPSLLDLEKALGIDTAQLTEDDQCRMAVEEVWGYVSGRRPMGQLAESIYRDMGQGLHDSLTEHKGMLTAQMRELAKARLHLVKSDQPQPLLSAENQPKLLQNTVKMLAAKMEMK